LQTAEHVKIEIGSIAEMDGELSKEVRGRDVIGGLPRKCMVTSSEIREALTEPVAAIIDCVTRTLESAEPELAADLVETGIYLAGGGALLRGLDKAIAEKTGLDVNMVDDPLSCVARGTSVYLDNLGSWKDTMESDADVY
jgi:rod shape-determining protein MreB